MRISHVMLAKGFGGAERIFVDLCLAQAARGVEIQAICHPRAESLGLLADTPGIHCATVRAWGAWDPFAGGQIARLLRRFDAELCHAHLARAAHLAGQACRRLGVPLLVDVHNYVDLKYYRAVDLLVATTADELRYLLAEGVAPARTTLIPNFSRIPAHDRHTGTAAASAPPTIQALAIQPPTIQPPTIQPPTIEPPTIQPPTIKAYGRLVRKKGFHCLLDALAQVRRDLPAVRLVLGGTGPEEAALRAQAAALGLGEAVTFVGWVADVDRFLADATLFCLPSLDEPFGVAILEAMAGTTPLVATLTQGPREILSPATAWLVPPGDAPALAAALADALADATGRQGRALAACRLYAERYSEAAVVPRYLDRYAQLIAARRRPSA
jgi:glycosyltransferase involved in cell wall biosynthesis